MIDKENPIFKPFQRLKDAHNHWHRAEAEYHDPDGFRLNLNSCIQDLRSVTFVLQKQKSKIPDFEKNYKLWQKLFKAELVLRWLVQARNIIVKEGDLETKSVARVYVVRSYLADPYAEFEINPLKSLDEIPHVLELNKLPNDILENGYLKIERRWVASDLPNFELLEALKIGFYPLLLCLDYFYKKCSGEKSITLAISCHSNDFLQEDSNSPPSPPICMNSPSESRSVLYKLKDSKVVTLVQVPQELIPKKEVLSHYGDDFFENLPQSESSSLKSTANYLFSIGKKMLEIDGYHSSIAILMPPSKSFLVHQIRADDQADKYVLWKKIADEVLRTGAEEVFSISEAWSAPFDPQNPHRPAKDSPDRIEVLQLVATSKSGEEVALTCKFQRRENGEIILGSTEEGGSFNAYFLEPVKQIWRKG